VDDILRVRAKTTGINEIEFKVNRYNFQMVDVGGQRSERRKWIHCFTDVTAIIFCAASSEYDQKLYEDESTNRMMEALKLFKDITNSKWFRNTPIMLFLNKDDLFRTKIQKVPLNVCFKNYTGDNSYDDAIGYIEDQFLAQISNPNKLVYAYKTTATDTDNITRIFQAVKNIFITAFLTQMGLGIPGPTVASYGKTPSSTNNSSPKTQPAASESPTRVPSRKSLPKESTKAIESSNGAAKEKRKDSNANSNETTTENELGSSAENSPTERRASMDAPKRKNSNAKKQKKKKAGESNGQTEAAHLKEVTAQ
jgi:GTPase SAR1 family protein